ncbi:MAG: DUF3857 domain-containing protein [Nitrospiraceae bacterium]|nr:DUF3857 domain-containing protein [Nitrospiraceae bacterium]
MKQFQYPTASRPATSLSLALVLLVAAFTAQADTLYLRGAEQEPGRLKSMTEDAVVFEGADGEKTFEKKEILRIALQRARKFDEIQTVEQITDERLRECLANQPSREDYPAAGSVTLLELRTIDLTRPGIVIDTHRFITKVLQQRGEAVATQSVWYFEDTDMPRIDFALTVTPDGRVLHLDDAALKNESIHASFPDYRRLSRFRFACKEPRPGSILDVQYSVVRERKAVLEDFYAEELFRAPAPILRKEVKVIVPLPHVDGEPRGDVGKALSFATDGPWANGLTVETFVVPRSDRDLAHLVWRLPEPQPGIITEPLMPPRRSYVGNLTLAVPATWEELSTAYAETLSEVAPLSDALIEKARKLKAAGGAAAIHSFVARNVRMVDVPQRHYRLVPYPPDETVRRGMANELDKNFLYHKMLEAAGIDNVFALVRGRGEGPIARDVPSLRAFNRTAVYLKKQREFSSAADDQLPFGALPGGLQDVPALLIREGEDKLTTTQQASPKDELDATTFEATLDEDGRLELTVTYSGNGNNGQWIRQFKDLDDQNLRNQLEQIAGMYHPAATLDSYEKTDLADLTVPPALTLQCTIPGYAVKAGDDLMLFNIPAVLYYAGQVGRPTREHDLFWDHVKRSSFDGVIHFPKTYKVHSLPNNVKSKSDIVSYRARLRKGKSQIRFKDQFDLRQAPAAAYADYKECLERRADLARQRIILTRK